MIVKILDQNFDKKRWDEKAPHPLQSWAWGEARRQMGIEVLRIGEFLEEKTHSNDSLQNVYQMTLHRISLTNFKIGYLPRSVFPSKEALTFFADYGRKNNVVFIKIEPYVLKSEIRNTKFETNSKFKIQNSKHPLFPSWTIMIDLTKSEEELLKQMKPKTRYNIKLAQKKGVVVKEMSNEVGFKIFSQLYFETCRRQKYFGHTPKYHQIVWENLKNKIAYILIAFYKDIPLAAYELFYFKKILYYPYGGTSLAYRNFMASNILMWEAIRLGKKLGAEKFDMWGSLPPDYNQNHPWAGFTRFKQGYGGEFVEMTGSYDLIINKTIYQLYNLIYFLRNNIYLKIRRLI